VAGGGANRLADLRARGSNDWPAICPIESPSCLACQKCRVAWEFTSESKNEYVWRASARPSVEVIVRDPKSERGTRNGCRPWGRAAGASLLAGLLVIAPRSAAASDGTPERAGTEVFHLDTALGRIDYHAGRGLRLGNTGLTIGGFAIMNAERLEGGESRGDLEGPTFLVSFEPVPFLRGFAELETTSWRT
jgi:hypothetical protein